MTLFLLRYWRFLAGALLLALLVTAAVHISNTFDERDRLKDEVATAADVLRLTKRASAASEKALTGRLKDRTRILTITKEIIREVPVLVPPGTPALPGGFRVLHDAAALGVPAATRGADAAPAPAQDAATTIVDNYGTCRDTASQLERLQQWIRELSTKP